MRSPVECSVHPGQRVCHASVFAVPQVSCNPPGLIVVDVQQLRTTAGGYIKLALDSVKGSGQLTGIALRQTPSLVSCRDGVGSQNSC